MTLEVHRWGARVVARRPDTGRWWATDAATWDRFERGEAPGVELALGRAGLRDATPLADLVVVRSRRALLLPARPAVWAPEPLRPTPGGHVWAAHPLTDEALALWRACNDARTVAEAARAARLSTAAALGILAGWLRLEAQLATLRAGRPSPHDPGPWLVAGPPRPEHARSPDQRGDDGRTTLGDWHHAIGDAATHFDRVETTIAHVWARPHPALGGVPYGARLRARLRERGLPVDGPALEVGCGDGELARDWAPEAPWLRLDLSPALLRRQAEVAPTTAGVLADAVHLPVRDGSVPFLLSNEVLADLTSVPAGRDDPAVRAFLAELGAEAPQGWANLGAWQLVAEVARVLAPGGAAVLTEFGAPDEAPAEAVQLDHPEVSIAFDLLAAVAAARGLRAELVRLDELLGVDPAARHLGRPHWEGVRALWAAAGGQVEARAWTAADVPLPEPVEGLQDEVVTRPGPGPLVTRFWALVCRRPC